MFDAAKRKKQGLGWYFGMTFGDPVVLARPRCGRVAAWRP